MRFYYVALLAAVAMLAYVAADPVAVDSQKATMPSSLQHDVPATRRLRMAAADEDGEERANIKFPGLEKVLAERNMLKEMKKNGQTADEAFTFLRLEQESGSLFSTRNFNVWKKYVKTLDPENPRVAMIKTLRGQYGDADLSVMLQQAKRVKSTKKPAMKLQNELFEQWHFKQQYDMRDVYNKVFNMDGATWAKMSRSDTRFDVYKNYRTYIRRTHDELF
ncbi:hypothetical protein PR003_g25218 [Phytophthora rubi]|uniref:RxLR effector protein n=1 Tax=Phytophthora rubi TaxID=129364 RepID=A0A6A4CK67_9STRA|nr:hypothetical protein PR002_g24444 [Phytophthora rubi]KAE8980908.1 hypothetical protein PR001_g24159 [Phytophthora rubi]KAE9290717.1 hypothetical protein PR003_g25218 [Phytophthora rubi]